MNNSNQETTDERLDRFLKNPRKALWTIAVPVMIGMAAQTLYNITDMIFVGQISSDAITALAFNIPVVFFAIGFVFALSRGVTAVISQFIGARSVDKASMAAIQAVYISLVISMIFSIGGVLWGKSLLGILGTPDRLLPLASGYIRILAAGLSFTVFNAFFRSIFSGEGNTKTPMILTTSGVILNIILDPIFIFVFKWGLNGAAYATVLSQGVIFIGYNFMVFIKKKTFIDILNIKIGFDSAVCGRILKIGIPASLSMIVMSLGSALYNYILVHFSPDAVAAYQIGTRFDHIFLLPTLAVASSVLALVGMFFGAKRIDLVREVVRYSYVVLIKIALVLGSLFYVISPWAIQVFTDNSDIRDTAVSLIRVMVFIFPFIGIGIASSQALIGLGHGVYALLLACIRVIFISAPLASYFILIANKSIEWAWYSLAIAAFVSAIIAYTLLRKIIKDHNGHSTVNVAA